MMIAIFCRLGLPLLLLNSSRHRIRRPVGGLLQQPHITTTLRSGSSFNVENNNNDDDYSSDATAATINEEIDAGELCLLAWDDDDDDFVGEATTSSSSIQQQKREDAKRLLIDQILFLIPIVVPIVAYFSYENVALLANDVTELLSVDKNFQEVDGGSYRTQIIAPAINGVIMPACAVTFATLLSITISTLRQRQQDIRATINMEAGELRVLQAMVDKAFPTGSLVQDRCRLYLIQYTSRLIAESQPTTQLDQLEGDGGDSEMNGFLDQMIDLDTEDVRDAVLSESFGAISRLNSERSTRISALQSTFPALHYAILSVLAFSMCISYLLETNQELLIFLSAVQLKLLWTILVGIFAGLGAVCYDLKDPFQGSYQISKSVDQIYTIRKALRASSCQQSSSAEEK